MQPHPERRTLLRSAWLAILVTGCAATGANVAISPGDGTAQSDVKLWYRVSGSGPVAILPAPGWGPSSELYSTSMPQLEELFTVVYLDTRGSGRSERPEPDTYGWSEFVCDLDAVREQLGLSSVTLIGHSAGGAMVMQYALAHPDRVRALILVDALAATDEQYSADRERAVERYAREPWFERALAGFGMAVETDEDLREMLGVVTPLYFATREGAQRAAPVLEKTSYSAAAFIGTQKSGFFPFSIRDRLTELEVPALVIVGREDAICPPEEAARIHEALARSQLFEIESAGHLPWLENPTGFYEALREGMAALDSD
jgi:proline iminopeptidase